MRAPRVTGAQGRGSRRAGIDVRADLGASPAVVCVSGELDLATAPRLAQVLSDALAASSRGVVVDVSKLVFLDAAGLGVLARAHDRLLGEGRPGLSVRGAEGIPRRVLEIAGLGSLSCHPDSSLLPRAASPAAGEGRALEMGRQAAGLSVEQLFVAYFALGGTANLGELGAFLGGQDDRLDDHQRDVAAHALNERLIDRGRRDLVLSYAADLKSHPEETSGDR